MHGRFAHRALGGHPFFWGLLIVAAVAAIVALVVYLLMRRSRPAAPAAPYAAPPPPPQPQASGGDPAVEAARLRYAQGELTREQYAQIVADLTGQPVTHEEVAKT